jgi:hypothetical protein
LILSAQYLQVQDPDSGVAGNDQKADPPTKAQNILAFARCPIKTATWACSLKAETATLASTAGWVEEEGTVVVVVVAEGEAMVVGGVEAGVVSSSAAWRLNPPWTSAVHSGNIADPA